jgi:hypothetical protein
MPLPKNPKAASCLGGLLLLLSGSPSISCDLDSMVGWTLIARKTIEGRIDKGVRHDDFEGCEYDRIIVFTDNTGVRCTGYSYSYSYRPTAYIWANSYSLKMCVGSSSYSVARLQ